MTPTEVLCVLSAGWKTTEEHATYLQAQAIVRKEAEKVYLTNKIKNAEVELAKLKEAP